MLRRCSNGFHFHLMFSCLHSFNKSLILYSTAVASSKDVIKHPLMVDFLVESAGFSEQEAISIATKVRVNQSLITTKKSELVVDFLKESGFDGAQIRKLIAGYPNVLRNNVDKTLKPKIRSFQDVGISGSDLGQIISRHPDVLGRSVESSIVPVFGLLKTLLGSNEQLVRFMLKVKSQRLFCSQVCKNLPGNMLLLQSYGLTSERIKWLLLHSSILFGSTQWVEKLVKGVEEKLGIPRTSDAFMIGIYALTKKNEEKMESWLESLRSYGWSETDISTLLRRQPLSVSLAENHLRVKLKYFMEDLGLGSDYLATRPALLSFSMEKRIVPRLAVRQTLMDERLLERPMDYYYCLVMAKSMFMLKYVLPYKEKLPQLYENYTQATSYSLPLKQSLL